MPEKIIVSKESLPTGRSYPIKTSTLVDALSRANIDISTNITYYRSGNSFVEAWHLLPNEHVPCQRLSVRVGTVEGEYSREARDYAQNFVIPDLVAWIGRVLMLLPNSTLHDENQIRIWNFKPRKPL